MKEKVYKCKFGCGFETPNRWAIGGHTAACILNPNKKERKKKDTGKPKRVRAPFVPGPQVTESGRPIESVPTAVEVAEALLNKVVAILTENEGLIQKCAELDAKCLELSTTKGTLEWEVEQLKLRLKEVTTERDRILKIHNMQVRKGNRLSSTEELLRLAGLSES